MVDEDNEATLETTDLLSVPGLLSSIQEAEEDIAAGRVFDAEDVFGQD